MSPTSYQTALSRDGEKDSDEGTESFSEKGDNEIPDQTLSPVSSNLIVRNPFGKGDNEKLP